MIELLFTGKQITGLDKEILATCVVRDRNPDEVLMEKDGHIVKEGGRPYKPMRFPAGRWQITAVLPQAASSIYYPCFVRTNAHQDLPLWRLDRNGHYKESTGETFVGWGYGIHHARYHGPGGYLVTSNTTLGCINILSPDDAAWFGDTIEQLMGAHEHIYFEVPEHWE
jgi:hypothetical protein